MKTAIALRILLVTIFITTYVDAQGKIQVNDSISGCEKINVLMANYQFQEAITLLNRCYHNDSTNIDYLKKIGSCYFRSGRLVDAKNIFKKILDVDSINRTALQQLAQVYSKEANYQQALEKYKELIEIDSTNSYYHKQIAILSSRKGDVIQAIAHYQKAQYLDPRDLETIAGLCEIFLDLEQYALADAYVKKGQNLDPKNIKLIQYQVKSAYQQQKFEEAIVGIKAIEDLTQELSAYMSKLLGLSYYFTKDYKRAIEPLKKVIETEPESDVFHYYLGLVYSSIGEYEKSVPYFEKAIENGVSKNLAKYYNYLGESRREIGNFEGSIRAYREAYRISENDILLYQLARNYDIYYKDKKIALKYYQKYLVTKDTINTEARDYSKHRISELKEHLHMNAGS